MLLYADEDFAFPAVEELRVRGYDVLTAQEDDQTAMSDAPFWPAPLRWAVSFRLISQPLRTPASSRGGARRHSDRIPGFRSSGSRQSDRRKAREPISWPKVLPRESAAVSLKYRRWDLNPHGCYPTGF